MARHGRESMAMSCAHESDVRELPTSKDVNMGAEESTALGCITKLQSVKTEQAEKCMTVNCRVCRSMKQL